MVDLGEDGADWEFNRQSDAINAERADKIEEQKMTDKELAEILDEVADGSMSAAEATAASPRAARASPRLPWGGPRRQRPATRPTARPG